MEMYSNSVELIARQRVTETSTCKDYIYIYIYIYKQTNYQKKKYDKAKRVLIVRSKGQN